MNYKLHSLVAATLAGSLLMGLGVNAMADSTFDLVQALVQKGVLTEEEAMPLMKGRENDISLADKKVEKAKSKVVLGDYINSITPTGDMRVRYETRESKGMGKSGADAKDYLGRGRYAWHLGLKTASDNDFFTEIRFASNSSSRSPNVDFAQFSTANSDGVNSKNGSALVDRAYIGWNAADWLTLIAGRQENQLYTTSLVWDGDVTPEGLTEKINYKIGNTDVFANLGQWYLKAKYDENTSNIAKNTQTTKIFPIQVGAHGQINDDSAYKVAATYYIYAGDKTTGPLGTFNPGNPASSNFGGATLAYGAPGTTGVNNLKVLEVPAEYNLMAGNLGMKVFGEYAHNFDADARAKNTGDVNLAKYGSEDNAFILGMAIGSAPDLKTWEKGAKAMKKRDWAARAWYQRVEAFALDANLIDSDIMNAQVNMQGVAARGDYMLADNAFVTLIGAHGTRINDNIGTGYSVDTSNIDTKTYNLLQADVTWRF